MTRQQSAHRLTVAMVAGHHALEALLHPEDHRDPLPYLDDALAELAAVRQALREARTLAGVR